MTVFELIEANGLNLHGDIEHFAALVEAAARADEREECAELCDGLADTHEKLSQWSSYKTADTLAQAIRARGTT